MFTSEIRINGTLIVHIYGRNLSLDDDSAQDHYYYEVYRAETRKIRTGTISHHRPDGIEVLIGLILNDAAKALPE